MAGRPGGVSSRYDEGTFTSSSLAYLAQDDSWTARLRQALAIRLDSFKLFRHRVSLWTLRMFGRSNQRTYLYALIAAALLFIILVPQSSLPQKTGSYVKNLLGHQEEEKPVFNPDKWFYQAELDMLEPIAFDFERVKGLPPHNYHGPGHPTFATLYASRNATMHDPYFDAAQQIVFRLLWRQRTMSKKYPVTVFVTQYVNQTQRDYFTAAGAIVRELAIRPFEPDMKGIPARLQDMFSKLEMWRQLDFSRIAYLDSDAIPIENIDGIFDEAPDVACNYTLLPEEDKVYGADICNYAFAAHAEGYEGINAGVMIFKPEQAMYRRLIRESNNKTGWDTGYLEQALLSHLYHNEGPFPPSEIELGYNSFPDYKEQGIPIKILHDKMWAHYFDPGTWMENDWKDTWAEMEKFYTSDEFYDLRIKDARSLQAMVSKDSKKLPHVTPPPHAIL